MRTLQGFLFGHYDSRGGTTFVEDTSFENACIRYATAFGYNPATKLWFEDTPDVEPDIPEGRLKGLADADFLCRATIEIDENEPWEGADLDGGMTGLFDPDTQEGKTAWVLGEGENEEFLSNRVEHGVTIRYGEKPVDQPAFAPRWDDDAFGLVIHQDFNTGSGAP